MHHIIKKQKQDIVITTIIEAGSIVPKAKHHPLTLSIELGLKLAFSAAIRHQKVPVMGDSQQLPRKERR